MEPIYGPLTATLCWHGLQMTWAMGFHGLHTLNDLHFCPFSQLGSHYPRMLSIPTSIVLLMGTITSTPRHLADWNMQAGALGGGWAVLKCSEQTRHPLHIGS